MLARQAWRRAATFSAACALFAGVALAIVHSRLRPVGALVRAGTCAGTGGCTNQKTAVWDAWGSAARAAEAAAAAAAAAAAGVTLEPRGCTVDLSGSRFSEYCVPLTQVCVDQGDIILHGGCYQQVGLSAPDPLPNLEPHKQYNFGLGVKYRYPWVVGGTAHGSEVEADLQAAAADGSTDTPRRGMRLLFEEENPMSDVRQVPRPRLRPVSSQEPRAYLAHPLFASCTVPVVWVPHWQNNLHHIMADTVVPLYAALEGQPWAEHIKLVIQTPDGLAMEPAMQAMLDTLSDMSVQTFADFSARLTEGAASPAAAAGPAGGTTEQQHRPDSYGGGGPQRCFQQLIVCGNGTLGDPHRPFHALGRHVVEALQAAGAVPPAVARCGAACGGGEKHAVLRVVFSKRSSPSSRQLLNAAELLKRCRGWQHTVASGAEYRLECIEVEFSDLVSGAAAAQLADVLVGIHGAQLSNAVFMQNGSSTVEVHPCGFSHGYWNDAFGILNADDPSSQLQHWKVLLCDPSLCEPSTAERLKVQVPTAAWYAQNRHVRLPWQALETVLKQVLDARGDRQRYMQHYWKTGKWRLYATAGATVHGTCPEP